jgi:hypothetical protein
MKTRQKIRIGDIFQVSINESSVKFFQYMAKDATQLDSDVVRVFQGSHTRTTPADIEQIVRWPIDFYAHVFLKIGMKQNHWEMLGHSDEIPEVGVLFRNSNDYGNPEIRVSHDWHVWRINQSFERVGKLNKDYQNAEIGVVVPPDSLVHRMRTGHYDFVYPGF